MEKFFVTIMPEKITVQVSKGTNLLVAAGKAGINIDSPCGGNGTCGKCAVRIVKGKADVPDSSHIPQDLKDMGYIPACKAKVNGNVIVEVPYFSRLTRPKVMLSNRRTRYSRENDYFAGVKMNPVCRKIHISLEKPDTADNISDLERLKMALSKDHGINSAGMSLRCLRMLPGVIRKGDWDITVTVAAAGGTAEIVDIEPGKSDKPAYGMAVDIGTTTVVVVLLDMGNGRIIDRAGTYNRQSVYGSDIISRIIYADEHHDGQELLQKAAVNTINELVIELLQKHGLKHDDIPVMVCAGNTVMSHLFLKVPATYLRLEPYIPAAVKFPPVRAKELNMAINPDGFIFMLPSVASYVGGDITAGVLATMITRSRKITLFIDIGTNGELVLGNSDWLVTCSCSAGPAFEGSGISCGMRAMDGAIDWIAIDRTNYEVKYRTIGNIRPLGICGSGLIYSLSEMMDAGIMDRAGRIVAGKSSRRFRRGDGGMEYVLVCRGENGCEQDIVITESDVKNLLRAKAAIFAGIRTMLRLVDMNINSIERVYIAGGFGNYINIADAVNIGFLPDIPLDKYEYVGNSCIQGAMIALLSQEALVEAEKLADRMTYIELSIGNLFMEEFVSALFIPHTDLALFSKSRGQKAENVV